MFLIGAMLTSETLFYLQNDSYRVVSIYRFFLRKLKENFLNILMIILIIFCMIYLNFQSVYFCLSYLVCEIPLWIWAGNRFEYLTKIKYTKRMIRIISCIVILLLSLGFLLVCLDFYLITILFPLIFFLQYLIVLLSIVFLMPVEKMIGKYYLSKAKKKLSANNKLIKIGITGSFGKTSTKEILTSILACEYFTLATPKSYNTPFGVSKTINENLKNSHEMFVCEMGAKKCGEIMELCKLVDIDMGIITAVGSQHLETFGSIENVYRTKKEMSDYLYNKFCVFNLMNAYVARMYQEFLSSKIGVFILQKRLNKKPLSNLLFKKIRFKRINDKQISKLFFEYVKCGNVYARNLILTSEYCAFDIYYNGDFFASVRSSLVGFHNVINILLATAMAIHLNVSAKNIVLGVSNVKKIESRFQKNFNSNGAVIINNGYNSNLDSVVYSLKALNLFEDKIKVVITPGIVECKDMYKDNFAFGQIVSRYVDEVIIVKKVNRVAISDGLKKSGFNMKKVYFVDSFESVRQVLESLTSDYVTLIENDLPDNFS